MPFSIDQQLKVLEKKVDAINKAVWSLRMFFTNPINFSEKDLKQHWKDLEISSADLQTAKKAVFDFDIAKFITKQDIVSWKTDGRHLKNCFQ